MRITNKIMHNNTLRNLNNGLRRLDKLQQQLSSGKAVQLPSDDPAAVRTILQLRSSLGEVEQYKKNINDGISWLDSTDSALDAVTQVLHRARELAVAGASDTYDDTAREALAKEVEQLFDSIIQLANSSHGGRYLFSGQNTTTKPFVRESTDSTSPDYMKVNYQGGYILKTVDENGNVEEKMDTSKIVYEIGPNTHIDINVVNATKTEGLENLEEKIFTPIFQVLKDLRDNLLAGDTEAISGSSLADLDQSIDMLLRYRSEVGAKYNRLELARDRMSDLNLNFNRLLSNAQDIDVAETIMHLKAQENSYMIALAVSARIIPQTLVDYLR